MIDDFRGKYKWLSNFGAGPVLFEGELYPTSEHAYQAAKTLNQDQRKLIREAPTPGKAKLLGNAIVLRPGWDDMRVEVMTRILADKFTRNDELKRMLLVTGEEELVEKNTWGDRFWGACEGEGENNLGKILMRVRNALRS